MDITIKIGIVDEVALEDLFDQLQEHIFLNVGLCRAFADLRNDSEDVSDEVDRIRDMLGESRKGMIESFIEVLGGEV